MTELANYIYDGMYLVGFTVMMIVNLKTHKKYNLSKITTVIFTLITYVVGVFGAMTMGSIYTAVSTSHGGESSSVAIFGAVVFTPLIMSLIALLTDKSWRKIMDLLAPGIFIILACAKFGCYFGQCCPGIECTFGVYNSKYEMTMFPSQIFESITMCFVVAFCFWYAFRSKKFISGSLYPVTATVYSVTRFAWEFMRYYPNDELRHIILGLTFWQFWCVAVIILSLLWIFALRSEKLHAIEDRYYSFIHKKYSGVYERIDAIKHRNDKNIVHHKKKNKK